MYPESASAPCVIEARVNESASRTGRPNLPLTPDEIVADAEAVARAGAAILHWHGRDPATLRTCTDVALNRRVTAGVRAGTELLLHPTLGAAMSQDPHERTAYVAALNADPATRVDLAPIDFGSVNVDRWDAANRRFRTDHAIYRNTRGSLGVMLEGFRALDVGVVSVCWNVGHLRTARCFREMGLLGRTLWELVFTGEELPDGMAPTRAGFEAMVEQVPAGEPWSVACVGGDALELAGWAIEVGGHVSLGLGDWAYADRGTPTNADLVALVAGMAAGAGREVATPQQARELLRPAPPSAQPSAIHSAEPRVNG